MRVLLIAHSCTTHAEGLPRAYALSRLPGVELCVLTPHRWFLNGRWNDAETPLHSGYTHRIERARWLWTGPGQWYLHWYPQLPGILRRFRPDVIDLWEEPWGLISAHTCWLRDRLLPECKIVIESEQNVRKILPLPFERFRHFTLRRADYAIGRTEEALQVVRDCGYRGDGSVIGNAVDTELFQPADTLTRLAHRRALGVSGFVVGYVGRLVVEKGLQDLVNSLPLCPPNTTLMLVGDGPLRNALTQQVSQLGCADRVRFLGSRPQTELPAILNALDVLVLPSRTTPRWKEQFGRVIIEAHACGIPVVGSDSGAIPGVIGRGGLVVPEGDVAALGDALRQLHVNPLRSAALGRRGRRQVLANYTWQTTASKLYMVFRHLVGQSPSDSSPRLGVLPETRFPILHNPALCSEEETTVASLR